MDGWHRLDAEFSTTENQHTTSNHASRSIAVFMVSLYVKEACKSTGGKCRWQSDIPSQHVMIDPCWSASLMASRISSTLWKRSAGSH